MSTPSASSIKQNVEQLGPSTPQGAEQSFYGSSLAQVFRSLMVERSHSTLIQFFRYGFVGGAAFICDAASLRFAENRLGIHYLVAAGVGFFVGLLVNYWLSVRWVFDRSKVTSSSVQFGVFVLVGLGGLAFNELIMWALTDGAGWHYMLSKMGAALVVLLWNFFMRKILLF